MANDEEPSIEELIEYARSVIRGLNESSEQVGLAASALEVTLEDLEKEVAKLREQRQSP